MKKEKDKGNKHWEIIRGVLALVLTLVFIVVDIKYLIGEDVSGKGMSQTTESNVEASVAENVVAEIVTEDEDEETVSERETMLVSETITEAATLSEEESAAEQGMASEVFEQEQPTEVETEPELTFVQAPEGYFEDALFIGDSRTVGLYEYGGIEGADFFATSGMSVFRANYEKVDMGDKGTVAGIDALITNYTYGKIYVMLGINELGYPAEEFEAGYMALLDKLRQAQPEAVIFLQANMHVSEERSKNDEIYNNENLNRVNEFIETLADNKEIFYIDVNVLFDDENGYLRADITKDGAHTQGKYYIEWAQWLATKAIVK